MTGWKIFTGYLKAKKLDNQREKDNFPKIKKNYRVSTITRIKFHFRLTLEN